MDGGKIGALKNILIGLICASAIAVGLSDFYAGEINTYGNTTDLSGTTYNFTYISKLNETHGVIENLRNETQKTGDPASQAISLFGIDLSPVFGGLRLALQAPDMMGTMISDVSRFLGLPPWAPTVISTLLILIAVFGLLEAFLRMYL